MKKEVQFVQYHVGRSDVDMSTNSSRVPGTSHAVGQAVRS